MGIKFTMRLVYRLILILVLAPVLLVVIYLFFLFVSGWSNDSHVGFSYYEPDNALYIYNSSSMTNIYRIKMDMRDSTLKIRVSKRLLHSGISIKEAVYNRVKVYLKPGVEFIEYRGAKQHIDKLAVPRYPDEGPVGFLLHVHPRKYPYSLR